MSMSFHDKDKEKEYFRKYRREHRIYLNKEAARRMRERRKRDPEYLDKLHQHHRNYNIKTKLAAFDAYGGRFCCICGDKRISALTIDHIDGGGSEHRRDIGQGGSQFYRWLKKNQYPKGYRVLCMNCNHLEFLRKRDLILSNHFSARSKRKTAMEIKQKIMSLLGGSCSICGKNDIRILTVHHSNGGGNKERRIIGGSGSDKFYRTILGYESLDGYECRCFSCNCAENWND